MIVCTAQDFGFGPVSKLLAVTEEIHGIKKVFFGTGVAYELASLHHFDEIYCWSVEKNEEEIMSLLQNASLFLNTMDFSLCQLAKLSGCRHVFIDSLLWFWPSLPEEAHLPDLYICQDFFGMVASKLQEYKIRNAKIVPPITWRMEGDIEKTDQVMINFGGMDNPFLQVGKNTDYPFAMLKILLPILRGKFTHILVTGRGRVMAMLEKEFGDKDITFKMLKPREMVSEIAKSQALFTTPGIQTFYDAMDRSPIFCLLPQNNSNVKNLDFMVKNNAVKHYIRWQDLYNDFEKQFYICRSEVEEFKILKAYFVKMCCIDRAKIRKIKEHIFSFLENLVELNKSLHLHQSYYEGTQQVTSKVLAAINKRYSLR